MDHRGTAQFVKLPHKQSCYIKVENHVSVRILQQLQEKVWSIVVSSSIVYLNPSGFLQTAHVTLKNWSLLLSTDLTSDLRTCYLQPYYRLMDINDKEI